MRSLRFAFVLAAVPFLLAFTGNGFAGCGGASPPTGAPLPVAENPACFSDGDCTPEGCEDIRCQAGVCVVVADIRDADADGEAPPPCGMDCDDMNARVFPEAVEACNGDDDDCDTRIDEDAPPGAIATTLGTANDRISVAPIGDRMVLTDRGFAEGLRLRIADFDGNLSLATAVTDETPIVEDVCALGDGGILALVRAETVPEGFVIESRPLTLTDGGALLVGAAGWSLPVTARPEVIALEAFGTTFAIAWDDETGVRWLMVPEWSAPVQVFDALAGTAPLDVATDGTLLYVPVANQTVALFDAAGASAGMVVLPGRLADQPLASSDSDVVVGFRDTFDHLLARMTPSGIGVAQTAPAVGAGFPLRVDETPLGVLVTRFDTIEDPDVGVSAQLLVPTLDAVVATFPARDVSAGGVGLPVSFDVVASDAGTAVLTNFGDSGSVLTVLGCQPL